MDKIKIVFDVDSLTVDSHRDKKYYDSIAKLNLKNDYKLEVIDTTKVIKDGIEYKSLLDFSNLSMTLAITDIDDDGYFGTYSTQLSISKYGYRQKHSHTRQKATVKIIGNITKITIIDDFGRETIIECVTNSKAYNMIVADLHKENLYIDTINRKRHTTITNRVDDENKRIIKTYSHLYYTNDGNDTPFILYNKYILIKEPNDNTIDFIFTINGTVVKKFKNMILVNIKYSTRLDTFMTVLLDFSKEHNLIEICNKHIEYNK